MQDPDELFYKSLDLLRAMIAIPSPSRDEGAVADLVEAFLRAERLSPKRFDNNILVGLEDVDPERPTILLNSHIDTVRPSDGWTRDPYAAEIDPDTSRLYGLGSNDAGASVVSLIATYLTLVEAPQPYNLLLLLSAEEEVGGSKGMESMIGRLPKIDFAIVGEPTGMRPAIAEKGLMVLDATVHGKAGHAARNEGDNAIYKAIKVVETLRTLSFDRVSEMLGPVKITVTQINAGSQHNVVPDRCDMVVDVRTTDAYTNEETLRIIREAVPGCDIVARSTRLCPSGLSADHPAVVRAKILGLEPFGSPTLSDQALMPWPSMKMGPGNSSRSHTADEYIALDELRHAIDIYPRILSGLRI